MAFLIDTFELKNGRIHFDEAEFYTESGNSKGVVLEIVAAHEIGYF